jgi:dTDP-4-amino-4,6-dideoxygalactose transaminase
MKIDKPLHVGTPNTGDRDAFLKRVDEMFDKNWLTNNGDFVKELEGKLANYLKVKHVIATCNGTRGLEIAAKALNIQGEVIMPSFTFIATAHALDWLEITPVFCDIDPTTLCMDPERIEELITPKTSAIIGVHLFGRPCDTDALKHIAEKHGLRLYYDAAHAFGSSHKGKMIGNFGDCEVLSFHATKFYNTFEGGAISTNDDALARKIRLLVNYGFEDTDKVVSEGTNGKLNEISAAMGLTNLESLDSIIETNRTNYLLYQQLMAEVPNIELVCYNESEKNNWQYIVALIDPDYPLSRDELIRRLEENNILARRYFWPGCHRMEPYKTRQPSASEHLKNTTDIANRIITLPSGTGVTHADIARITALLKGT